MSEITVTTGRVPIPGGGFSGLGRYGGAYERFGEANRPFAGSSENVQRATRALDAYLQAIDAAESVGPGLDWTGARSDLDLYRKIVNDPNSTDEQIDAVTNRISGRTGFRFGDAGQPDSYTDTSHAAAPPSGGIFQQIAETWYRLTGQTEAANELEFPGPQPSAEVLAKAEEEVYQATGSRTPPATPPGLWNIIPWWAWAGGALIIALQLGWKPLKK